MQLGLAYIQHFYTPLLLIIHCSLREYLLL